MTENQKKLFSLILAAVITLIIAGLWFSFSGSPADQASAEAQDKLSSVSPWQVIKDDFSQAFSNFNKSTDIPSSTVPVEVINDEASSTATSTN